MFPKRRTKRFVRELNQAQLVLFDLPSYRAASDVEDYDLEDYGEAAVVPVGLAVATKEVGKLVPLRLKYGPEAA